MHVMRSVAVGLMLAAWSRGQEGTAVFISRCIQCHDPNSESHAPLPEALGNLPWQDILKAQETGSMKAIGAPLSAAGKLAVARYLGKSGPAVLPEMKGFCAADVKPGAGASSWNGWGVDEKNTQFQTAKAAGLTAEQVSRLQLKWAFGFPNTVTAYSQPTVVGGRVYRGSNAGTVYALDAQSGCLYWMYQAKTMVRDAVVIGPGPRAYFGDLESNFFDGRTCAGSRHQDGEDHLGLRYSARVSHGDGIPARGGSVALLARQWRMECCT
jgi:polyvinyl alcohol dehydrogenase (cytochrome)